MRACRNIFGYDIFCAAVFIAIFLVFGLAHLRINASSVSTNNSALLGNAAPSSSAIVINNGDPITLTPGATTTVQVSFNVTDGNGCGEVLFSGSVTTTLFRQSAGQSCTADSFNCYAGTVVHNCPSATTTQHTANATATFSVYYYADATDASSSYSGEAWHAAVGLTDQAGSSSVASTTSGVELNSLLAIEVASTTIDYEQVSAGANSGATNQESVVVNVGNTSTTLDISGTGLTAGANVIPTSSQHYATSTFTFGGVEQLLSATAQAVSGLWISPFSDDWASTTNLPIGTSNHAVAAYNNFIYLAGGSAGGTDTSTVRFAPLNASGSIGSWTDTTPLPNFVDDHPLVANNGYLYVIGGDTSISTATVYFAPINATGSIGSWTQTTPLPDDREAHPAVTYDGYLYTLGGGPSPTNINFFAPINSTGSVGTWATTTPLLISVEDNAAIAYDGYIYSIGGRSFDIGNPPTSTVLFAPLNATGSIGAWTQTTPLPAAQFEGSAVVYNGYIYVAGGSDAAAVQTSTVLFAPVNATGSLGAWSRGEPLPTSTKRHAAAVYNGYHYVIGGQNTSTLSTVRYNPLSSRNLYWGIEVPSDQPGGTYVGTITYTAVYSP